MTDDMTRAIDLQLIQVLLYVYLDLENPPAIRSLAAHLGV